MVAILYQIVQFHNYDSRHKNNVTYLSTRVSLCTHNTVLYLESYWFLGKCYDQGSDFEGSINNKKGTTKKAKKKSI